MVERVGKSFEVWWDSIKEKVTADQYLKFVEDFLAWRGWGYEEFFNKYFEARRSPDPRDLALMNTQFVNYFKEKRRQGFSSGYARNHVSAVIGFLAANGLRVEFTKQQQKEMAKKPVRFKDSFTKEEIQRLLASTTHPRNHAIIYALKDTGMAVSDLGDLNIKDVKTALDDGDKFTMIEYFRNKTEEYGEPCLGFEALDAIRDWLRWRREHGFNCNPDSPLFILTEIHEPHNYPQEALLDGIRMDGGAIAAVVKYIIKRAGITDKKLSAHCFRVFNSSQLESAGVNKNIVYRIQGRLIPDSGRVYSKGEVLSSYIKAYDSLTIGPKPQIIEIQNGRTQELERQLEQLQRQLGEQQRTIDLMMPTFKMAQKMFGERKEWEKLRGPPPER
jgi:site-specific recombinase XerD